MGDYYIQSINKTFFLSGSLIYHTDNSGSNANKNNGTLLTKDYLWGTIEKNPDETTVTDYVAMNIEVSGSAIYIGELN